MALSNAEKRGTLLAKIGSLLESLKDTYQSDDESEDRELIVLVGEMLDQLEE